MRKSLYLFFALLCVNLLHSINYEQQFRVRSFSVNEGLTQFTTGKVIQDHFGFIWVSTYDGLNRYDGNDFVKYRHDPYNTNSISGNRVLEINIDPQKNLWVVTENGSVDKYNYTTDQFEHYLFEPLKSSIVTEFLPDSYGNYWFGTTNGVYKARIVNNEFVVVAVFFNTTTPGYENFITSIVESSHGNMIVGTINGCRFLWHQKDNLYSPGRLLDNYSINYLFKKSNDETWMCTNDGIFILSKDAIKKDGLIDKTRLNRYPGYQGLDIRSVARIDKDNFLVSTLNSLFITNYTNKTNKALNLKGNTFFDNNIINSSIVDKTQTIWIGSQQKGIAKIDLHQLPEQIIGHEQTMGMFVKMLFRDSRGRTWIGANFNGLYYYEASDKSLKHVLIPETVPAYILFSPTMVEDPEGNLWLSVNETLYKYHYNAGKFERVRFPGVNLHAPFSLELDAYNSLWIGCTNGLTRYYFDNRKPEFVSIGNLSDMVSSEQVSRIVYDKAHNIVWACTKDNGVAALFLDKNGKVRHMRVLKHNQAPNSLNSNHVWSLVVASDGSVYIGTDSGLNKCEVKGNDIVVTPLKDLQLIAANKIMSIIEDKSKNLWLGTSQAVFSYNIATKKEKKYTTNNGMFANAALEAGFENNGYIFLGTINGLNIINTNPLPHNPFAANVLITDLLISGKSVKSDPTLSQRLKKPLFETKKVSLNYNENSIAISFMSTHYNDFEENIYEYKLEGYDKDFNTADSKSRTVHYNKLPAGKYTFLVKSSNNENVWGGNESRLTIIVRAAPWLSSWAFLGYFILVVGILYIILKYINKEAKYRQQLKIKDIERQHQEELNAMRLRFHTNIAHDIRTPITLIAAPLEDIKNDKTLQKNAFLNEKIGIIDKNVDRLLYLVNQFLDFRRLYNSGMKIEVAKNDVDAFFSQIKESFDGIAVSKKINFEYIVDVNHKYLIFDADKVAKIIINILSNAFKYTPEGGDVFVFVEKSYNKLRIKIQDSGCGIDKSEIEHIFERFYQAKEASSVSGTGIGLALVKQLVDLHGGTIDVESEKGAGTIITVSLPCELPEDIQAEEEQPNTVAEADATGETEVETRNRHTILVVEDDNDLRKYLMDCFGENYKTIEAVNGQDGFDKALRYVPDLIITDIMMPQVDGIQFIRLVRNDYRISHIPILALTAKTGDNSELVVLEAGAEDFIPKPFSTKALRLKVNNYLRDFTRKSPANKMEPAKEIVGIEEKFLLKMNEIILQNLENPIFSIDFICDKMVISRMQLHRKINSLLGKSTSEYIREIKMDVAKKYFENGETDIETVMLKIGVSSSFHFNKNFKQRYGISLHQFIKSLQAENQLA